MPLWDDATAPFTGQPQTPDDNSLLSHLYRMLGGSMFPASDPSMGQSMFSAEPQPITRSIDPGIQPTLALRDPERQQQAMDIALSFGPGAIRAFHGSPHDFPAFDINKIGTGEGNQTYGHGLYFAEAEPVAARYRPGSPEPHLIGPNNEVLASGNRYDVAETLGEKLRGVVPQDAPFLGDSIARLWAESKPITTTSLAREAWGGLVDNPQTAHHFEQPEFWDKLKGAIDATKPELEKYRVENRQAGQMYETNLNVEPEHLLDWDKPLSEQHPDVRAAVARSGLAMPDPGTTAGEWVNALSHPRSGEMDPAEVSRILHESGIPGIRYLDQFSRSAGQGTSNYVMFGDKSIDILRKYGVPGLITGGAAGAAANAENP